MDRRHLGNSGLSVSPIGFGAFKIGRNVGTKYAASYDLPDDAAAERLLHGVLDLGVNLIDTAPAYGLSEERIGRFLSRRRDEFVLSTKAGEEFSPETGSRYDFSRGAIEASVERSRFRLRADVLDLVFIHSDGRDREIIEHSGAVDALRALKDRGVIRAIGFSGKTVDGARLAIAWADAIMVTYHVNDRSHESVIAEAASRGVGVVVKKGLASGMLTPDRAIPFVLGNPAVHSMVVGGLNLNHLRDNCRAATAALHAP
ncbi:MAG: aldo/keto reductase [Phycisphaeraceae bacterium]|nr:MAG: aldo/keto reductase [Phycisphaeraceae bacterium]